MAGFDAVLFDFGHTLFDTTTDAIAEAFSSTTGRELDAAAFSSTLAEIWARSRRPEELAKGRDLSAEAHERCWLELLAPLESFGRGLARFTNDFQASPRGWRPYPDTVTVLAELGRRGIKIGVVSDCGWDIRSVFDAYGLLGSIDAFDLSFEHGICKPAEAIFASACATLGVGPSRTMMVGDNPLSDGGAAALGIATLIVPVRDRHREPALSPVLDMTS